ncbi:MAG: transcriptional regulator, partial [Planctomycetaceae bacterium]|nr:transcriptional regulator [Planctomycetaceae bacterium]
VQDGHAMGGLPPLERQWTILRTLSARRYGATVKELAAEFGVGDKTIRRDLSLLQDLGFPVEAAEGSHGRNHWKLDGETGLPDLRFDISEVLALYLGRTLLQPLAGTVVWESAQTALTKIRAHLGEPAVKYLDQLASLIHRTSFRDSCYASKTQLIDALMVAIEDRRVTFITYQSARSTESLTYDVYPYGLVYHRGSLYLVAKSRQHQDEVRTFKVDRLTDVALEQLRFQKPDDFNLRDYLACSLGIFHTDGPPQRVVIRFAPEVARYVEEHHWHDSQQLTRLKDSSLRVEFELSALEEVKSWVLSFGKKAVVEEPEDLRGMIAREIESLAKRYESTATPGRVGSTNE